MRKKKEKEAKKEAEKKEKEAKGQSSPKKKKLLVDDDDNIPPNQYFEKRSKDIQKLKADQDGDFFPYPHKWNRTHTLPELLAAYKEKCSEKGVFLDDVEVSVTGRVEMIRTMGNA